MATPEIVIYTDGACSGNPGPGGWAAILIHPQRELPIAGGARLTTNNRMELRAVIEGLRRLSRPCAVEVVSDSKYVVDAMEKGWARRWRENGWRRGKGRDRAENPDLWEELITLCDKHRVRFTHTRGHADDPLNNRCDEMAVAESRRHDLPPDEGYEAMLASKQGAARG